MSQRRKLLEDQLGWTMFTKLSNFFLKTWNVSKDWKEYQYTVYIARRCSNLNEVFYAALYEELDPVQKEALDKKSRHTFMTQHALARYVERWTLDYIRKGTPYPKVLIVDELVVYGHELNDLYYQIRRIVRDTVLSLLPDEEEVKRAQYAIWSHMDILTFAQNMDGILLNSSITSHMTAESTMSPLYWRQYIFNITKAIQNFQVEENENRFPSVCEPYLPVFWKIDDKGSAVRENERWFRTEWDYHERKNTNILQRNLTVNGGKTRVLGTIGRFRKENEDSGKCIAYLSALPLFGQLPKNKTEKLLELVADCLPEDCDHLRGIMESRISDLITLQMQLVSFILSVYSACDLLGNEIGDYQNNLSSCAMNFGVPEDTGAELAALYGKIVGAPSCVDGILDYLGNHCELLDTGMGKELSSKDDCIQIVEDIMADIAAEDDEYSAMMRGNRNTLSSMSRNRSIQPLSFFMDDQRTQNMTLAEKVSVLYLLVMDETCSSNYRFAGDLCEPRLKVGEYSKAIRPSKLEPYLPALAEIEYYCQVQYGCTKATPELSRRFGQWLKQRNFHDIPDDIDKQFAAFIDEQYRCGNKISSWNLWSFWKYPSDAETQNRIQMKAEAKEFLKTARM